MQNVKVFTADLSKPKEIKALEDGIRQLMTDSLSARYDYKVQFFQTATGAGAGTGATHSHAYSEGSHRLTAVVTW